MRIPRRHLDKFAREIANQCLSSRADRINRGIFFQNYASTGSGDASTAAMFNKTYASIDDLSSLLYSPVSLRFHIGDPDIPNVLNEAKGRAAAARIRQFCRQTKIDRLLIPQAVTSGLVKGMGLLKLTWKKGGHHCSFVPPEDFGVLRENHTDLDEDMEAFTHSMQITPYQFNRLVAGRPDEEELKKKIKRHVREATGAAGQTQGAALSVVVGGLYPFKSAQYAAGQAQPRGVVDWMAQPRPSLDPAVEQKLIDMEEVWVWDDEREDWATFQIIGDDMLIMGKYMTASAMSYSSLNRVTSPELQGKHPFLTFTPNPVENYFWGMSEVAKLVLLQEAINARITGTNKLLRRQEDPPLQFRGANGVNQSIVSKYKKPGGYFSDSNPQASVAPEKVEIPNDLWASLHEYERMFDELMGLPPMMKGGGQPGVRSHAHFEGLVRMFSPRFKDRALLTEGDVEALGALMLDLAKAHSPRKMIAWVPQAQAGVQVTKIAKEEAEAMIPPAPGQVPVVFSFADLPDDLTLTVDAHSSSPAFSAEAKDLAFNLLKAGAMDASTLVEHVDAPDPDELQAGIARREAAQAAAAQEDRTIRLATHSKK
jgi:hypothetical protein